jgi:hypothetical protein
VIINTKICLNHKPSDRKPTCLCSFIIDRIFNNTSISTFIKYECGNDDLLVRFNLFYAITGLLLDSSIIFIFCTNATS